MGEYTYHTYWVQLHQTDFIGNDDSKTICNTDSLEEALVAFCERVGWGRSITIYKQDGVKENSYHNYISNFGQAGYCSHLYDFWIDKPDGYSYGFKDFSTKVKSTGAKFSDKQLLVLFALISGDTNECRREILGMKYDDLTDKILSDKIPYNIFTNDNKDNPAISYKLSRDNDFMALLEVTSW